MSEATALDLPYLADIEAAARAAGAVFHIPLHHLRSKRRAYAIARQVAYWCAYERTPASLPCIARYFNKSDHTAVLHGVRRVEARRKTDPEFSAISDMVIEIYDGKAHG